MSFYVKVKSGEQTAFVTCQPQDTVATLKQKYTQMVEEAPKEILDGSRVALKDDETLNALHIDNGAVLFAE